MTAQVFRPKVVKEVAMITAKWNKNRFECLQIEFLLTRELHCLGLGAELPHRLAKSQAR
jgi:hypothetical protein